MTSFEISLFLGGFLQAVVVALNFRNIADKKIFASMFTAFVLSCVWGYVVVEIVRDLSTSWRIISYALGVSTGTGVGVCISRFTWYRNIQGR